MKNPNPSPIEKRFGFSLFGALLTAPLLPPHLYRSAFTNFHMGYSCALAWILVVIIGLAIAILFKTQNAWVHYEAE